MPDIPAKHTIDLTANRPYYPALDGIRGLAILLVVFFHNFGFINYTVFGWLGVDLFFVLSGYLITGILLKSVGHKNYLRNFYARRILRIFPLYYLFLVLAIFILPQIPSLKDNLQYYVDNQLWFWTFTQNWLFVLKTPEKTNFLLHFWSLAVEEQFYLIWPFIILFIRKPKFLFAVMAIILVSVITSRIILWNIHIESIHYFSLYTFTRFDGICIGCMLALLQYMNADFLKQYTAPILFSLSGLNFLFYFVNRYHAFTFPYFAMIGYTTFAIMFAILVHEAVKQESKIIYYIFNFLPLRFLGQISYGLYIFHWPVYLFLFPKFNKFFTENTTLNLFFTHLFSAITATVIGILISIVSYYGMERRILKWKEHFK